MSFGRAYTEVRSLRTFSVVCASVAVVLTAVSLCVWGYRRDVAELKGCVPSSTMRVRETCAMAVPLDGNGNLGMVLYDCDSIRTTYRCADGRILVR